MILLSGFSWALLLCVQSSLCFQRRELARLGAPSRERPPLLWLFPPMGGRGCPCTVSSGRDSANGAPSSLGFCGDKTTYRARQGHTAGRQPPSGLRVEANLSFSGNVTSCRISAVTLIIALSLFAFESLCILLVFLLKGKLCCPHSVPVLFLTVFPNTCCVWRSAEALPSPRRGC